MRRALAPLPNLRNRHFLLLDAVGLLLIPVVALMLRLDSARAIVPHLAPLSLYTLCSLIVALSVFWAFGLYHRYWKYATVDELLQVVIAVTSATGVQAALYLASSTLPIWPDGFPRSLPIIGGLLTLVMVGGSRFSVRLAEQTLRTKPRADAKNALVVGAGFAGQMLIKELQISPQLGLQPVGFLDDDAYKQGVRIANLPVFGTCDRLKDIVREMDVAEVIIAMPSASGKKIREVLEHCEQAGVPAKTLPGVSAILDGKVRVSQLRNVDIEDLLRREAIDTDIARVRDLLRGKRVLITGGGGSIGSELCRQVMQCGPSDMALFGHGENSIFEINAELNSCLNGRPSANGHGNDHTAHTNLHAIIADVRSPERVSSVVQTFRPDVVFHAAAHKHVPLMEMNPTEAITNNVLGTRNLLEAAMESGVEHFVMISTDKAVNPTSIMGASKRAAELLLLRAARLTGRNYVAVRFGNVLGSRGSVVPIFKRQIAAGGPVTVSHPDMRRYFMTIPEAVQLVLQASVLGQSGSVLMLDMGDPVKIVDLAHDLIELSGLEVGRDIDIVFSGVRPGEKLYEELFVPGEEYQPTQHDKILLARNASSFVPENLEEALRGLERAVDRDDGHAVRAILHGLIPEFGPELDRLPETARVSAHVMTANGSQPESLPRLAVAADISNAERVPVSGQ